MDSTVKQEQAGPQEPVVQRGDETSTNDYERIVREELARVQERLAKLAAAGPPPVPAAPPSGAGLAPVALDPDVASFRPAAVGGTGSPGKPGADKRGLLRSAAGLLVAAGIVGAALAWSTLGQAARATIEAWSPQLTSMVALASEKLGLSSQSNEAAGAQPASADQAAAQPADTAATTTPAATAQDGTQAVAAPAATPAPAAAPAEPDTAQLLQGMARDIASLTQSVGQLKANQEQLLHENARLAEQLKSSQEQMARLAVRAPEPNLHARPVVPKPAVAAVHRPPPTTTLPPPQMIAPQAAALPPAPAAAPEDREWPSALRPPRPVP